MLLPLLAALTFGLVVTGIGLFVRSLRRKEPFRFPKFLLAVPVLLLAMNGVSQREREATVQGITASAVPVTGEVKPFITPPGEESSEPFTPPVPVPTPTSDRTPAQLLAVIAGRDQDDPEIAAKVARLDAVCPDEGPSVADMVVKVKQLVLERSGRDLSVVNVLDQFLTAQEGAGDKAGLKCSEVGGMLVELMIKGM